MYKHQQVIAVLPARDEALSIAEVIDDIKALNNDDETAVFDRILVCDNASVDETAAIAKARGAEVVHQAQTGYGIACLTALELVEETDIVVFIDADASLQIDEAMSLLAAIDQGADLAIGARIRNWREEQSMTFAQSVGNTVASLLIRLIWQVSVTDLGPFRAVRYSVLTQLDMHDRSYGWTVEMQVKAIQHGLNMVEVPVHYRRRLGRSKISGTLNGVIGAGFGIISMILKLALRPSKIPLHQGYRQP